MRLASVNRPFAQMRMHSGKSLLADVPTDSLLTVMVKLRKTCWGSGEALVGGG